jgi:hypothetical protein
METGFEFKHSPQSPHEVQEIMNRFGRSRVLEVYFARLDERLPEVVPSYEADLYLLPLSQIKEFLLEQGRHDPLLKKILETKF